MEAVAGSAFDLSREPLRLVPDQGEHWINYSKPVSFDEAAQTIIRAATVDGDRLDLGVGDLSTWFFGPLPDGTAAITPAPVPGRQQHLVPLRTHAFRQLCARTGAPSSYVEKLPAKLQIALVNHGLRATAEDGRAATLRLAGGSARAIVSDRYAALDDERVLEVLRNTLRAAGRLDEAQVRAVSVGTTTALRMTFPEHTATIARSRQVGDIVETGLDIVNGEIGNRFLSFTPSTWRLACLNGMRRQTKEVASRLRHTGDPNRLLEAFTDALPVALAGGVQLRERMARSVDNLIDDVLGEFAGLSAFGLRAAEIRDVTRDALPALPASTDHWAEMVADVRDLSQYDVANAITHFAQSRPVDRRIELEEAASAYLFRAA